MRYTKETVNEIVQNARCVDCGESHKGAMQLHSTYIVCANCAMVGTLI